MLDLIAYDNDVYYFGCEWGDTDLDWIILDACSTLQYDDYGRTGGMKTGGTHESEFAKSLNGIRLICGAQNELNGNVDDRGQAIADLLIDSDRGGADYAHSVYFSWFVGYDDTDEGWGDEILSILAEDWVYTGDYIWGQADGPYDYTASVDNYYYEYTFTCT